MMIQLPATIRNLAETDFEDVLTLYRELTGNLPVLEGEVGKKQFGRILNSGNTTIVGADVGSRIVSVATLHTLENLTFSGRPYCLIENVVTLKSYQKRGLAREVMNAIIKKAWDANACRIVLLTGKSLGASGFYEKLGFTADKKYGMLLTPDSQ